MTELADFEKDKKITISKENFRCDIKFIKSSDKVFVNGDKSRNPHKLFRIEQKITFYKKKKAPEN